MSKASSASRHSRCQVIVPSPIPAAPYIVIRSEGGELSKIDFQHTRPKAVGTVEPAAALAIELIKTYFSDSESVVPPQRPLTGTPFQQRVWQALQQIPPGETRSYGRLAKQLASSAQAVANACRANPLPILIPCHRVVRASGIGGYMGQIDGSALEIKRWLLHHEGHV